MGGSTIGGKQAEAVFMAVILSEVEGQPSAWPSITGFDDDALKPVWQRVESWIATRWRSRSIVWVIEGPGEWTPRLAPFTLVTVERWDGAAWVAETATPAPLGYDLGDGTYRVTGTVGDTSTPPPAVIEAVSRLAKYLADDTHQIAGASSQSESVGGVTVQHDRSVQWLARALTYSGAGDLLRPWRRA